MQGGIPDIATQLLDDADRRVEMGRLARHRCAAELDWAPQSRAYVGVFDRLFGVERGGEEMVASDAERRRVAGPPPSINGHQAVNLRPSAEFDGFLRNRTMPELPELPEPVDTGA